MSLKNTLVKHLSGVNELKKNKWYSVATALSSEPIVHSNLNYWHMFTTVIEIIGTALDKGNRDHWHSYTRAIEITSTDSQGWLRSLAQIHKGDWDH